MTISNNKNIFLFGDSIIENSKYVKGQKDVTTCLQELWQNKVYCAAWDGGVMSSIKTQYKNAIKDGFNPENDIAIVSVIGNNLTSKIPVFDEKTKNVAEAMIRIHQTIAPLYKEYTDTIQWLTSKGVKNLALVTIYPVHDFTAYGMPGTSIDNQTLTWILVTPVLALINKHIVTTANSVGAKVVDLFNGQIDAQDVVYSIEPGATASPKIAKLMFDVANTFIK